MTTKKTNKPLLMTNAQYSKHRGISAQRVGVLRKSKQLVLRDGKIDAVASDERLDSEEASNSTEALSAARARKESTIADLRALELQVKSGALVSMADVKLLVFNKSRAVRDGILAVPARLAHKLAAESDPQIIRTLLRTELVNELRQLSDDLAKTN